MAKGILKYSLPEEQSEFETARNGWRYRMILADLAGWLRTKLKHQSDSSSDQEYAAYEAVRDELFNMAGDEGVSIWE